MGKLLLCLCLLLNIPIVQAQTIYFPPAAGTWQTMDPSTLNWCPEKLDSLKSFLGEKDTKAFIILQDGKILVEWYFGTFTQDSLWYWASAGKSLTSVLIGIARQEGKLQLDDPSNLYLGKGWTSCTSGQEDKITIRNQLTMTTGLDDKVPDDDCTDPACLQCLAEPGSRWAYHNAPYTRLDGVLESVSGLTLNQYYKQKVGNLIGAGGFYYKSGFNNVFVSRARDMARFGLLMLAKGNWNGSQVLKDSAYFYEMTHSSQALNKSYGYLWWLNGKGEHMLPELQLVFQSDIIPNAPDDLFAALGKNDQKIYVVPSENRVVIRMGNAAAPITPALSLFDDVLWEQLENMTCDMTATTDAHPEHRDLRIFPVPADQVLRIRSTETIRSLALHSAQGHLIRLAKETDELPVADLAPGLYMLGVETQRGISYHKILIQHAR